ncbi:Putative ABC-transporter type IV [Evansella caseinilytica]|uniref:Putative ABC-transporter type IV n=1 Tax=Evansella caseinilytica TaxID=1503961 RepID=A0A1H3P0L7_9BACI|nr:putative ABC transporter permease [Evansella caseinilytica]SDY94657.1 Putative ABC-transporter type IV [Evansella caseinilytica]
MDLLPVPLEVFQPGGMEVAFFYFIIYSLCGWLLENGYSKLTSGVFWKDGFLKGPLKPMYGFAPLLLVISITPEASWFTVILLCFTVPTVIEYVTGWLLNKLFQQQWWDYTNIPLQLHGLICLPFSLCWLVLSIACVYILHPAVVTLYHHVNEMWHWLAPVFAVYLFIDVIWTSSWRFKQKQLSIQP